MQKTYGSWTFRCEGINNKLEFLRLNAFNHFLYDICKKYELIIGKRIVNNVRFPFWSFTHFKTLPSSSFNNSICSSDSIASSAFCITLQTMFYYYYLNLRKKHLYLQPYIWSANDITFPLIFATNWRFWSAVPNSKNFWIT